MPNNQEVEFFWFQCESLSDYDENSWKWDLHKKKGGERNHAYVFDAIKIGSQVLCYHLQNGIIGRFVVIDKTNDSCYLKLEEEMNIQLSDEICKEVHNKKDENGKYCPIGSHYKPLEGAYFAINRAQFEYLCSKSK